VDPVLLSDTGLRCSTRTTEVAPATAAPTGTRYTANGAYWTYPTASMRSRQSGKTPPLIRTVYSSAVPTQVATPHCGQRQAPRSSERPPYDLPLLTLSHGVPSRRSSKSHHADLLLGPIDNWQERSLLRPGITAHCPTLAFHGEHDTVTPPHQVRELAATLGEQVSLVVSGPRQSRE
jgi:pimeloyl-ACP methyl ester carboxylesterase